MQMIFEDNGLFRGKYRVSSARLPQWDYSSVGAYFITICTKDREELFGEIRNGIMGLNKIGCMTATCWQEIPRHFTHTSLDEWVIMPNHLHGIIWINDRTSGFSGRDVINHVSTNANALIQNNPMQIGQRTLGGIIRWFKGRSTHFIHNHDHLYFAWQSRFYDHIIRDEKSLNKIRRYIQVNPLKWELDLNNPKNFSCSESR